MDLCSNYLRFPLHTLSFLLLFVLYSSCGSIRDTTEDYTINHSRSSRYESSRKVTRTSSQKERPKRTKPKEKETKVVVTQKRKTKIKTKNSSKDKNVKVVRRKIKNGSTRGKLIEYSAKYDGTRYKYGGKNPFGFDCSGFTSYVFKKIDIRLPPSANLQSSYGEEIPLEAVNEGDLLFFETEGTISHVALVVSNDEDELLMRHASKSSGVIVVDYYKSKYWQKRFSHAIDVLEDK